MRLLKVRVQNYKCIEDSTEFTIGPVTCLVGKNESGKTAVLQALYKLKPVVPGDSRFEMLEYPRRRYSEYKDRHVNGPDPVVTTTWEIEPADRDCVAAVLGPSGLKSETVVVTKDFDNREMWTLTVDERYVVKHYLDRSGLHQEELANLSTAKTVKELVVTLASYAAPSEREAALLQTLQSTFKDKTALSAAVEALSQQLPRFVYFGTYDRLPGQVSVTDLLARQGSQDPSSLKTADHIFMALLDLAGTKPEDLDKAQKYEELIAELEGVQNRITEEIFNYWSQNRYLRVSFKFDYGRPGDPPPFNSGWVFRTRIENTRHGVTVGLDDRSTGFVWFFSFLAWFSQLQKHYGSKLVVLLDEPGLSLHGRAQADLLRYINERLKGRYQVLYTTHSPFMVDADNLSSVRTVEDVFTENGKPVGTKIGEEVLSTDPDTVFPLQAALGYDITQSMSIGPHALVVEGPSDLLYLKWFSRQLRLRGRTDLDSRWTISAVGGIDKVRSFVALFSGKVLHTAVFTDNHAGNGWEVRRLRESGVLGNGCVLTADTYTGQAEADIEDMVGRRLYINVVNRAYGLAGDSQLSTEAARMPTVRAEVASHFTRLNAETPRFDHGEPAVYLTEHVRDANAADQLPEMHVALDRFEQLFRELNALLPSR